MQVRKCEDYGRSDVRSSGVSGRKRPQNRRKDSEARRVYPPRRASSFLPPQKTSEPSVFAELKSRNFVQVRFSQPALPYLQVQTCRRRISDAGCGFEEETGS